MINCVGQVRTCAQVCLRLLTSSYQDGKQAVVMGGGTELSGAVKAAAVRSFRDTETDDFMFVFEVKFRILK